MTPEAALATAIVRRPKREVPLPSFLDAAATCTLDALDPGTLATLLARSTGDTTICDVYRTPPAPPPDATTIEPAGIPPALLAERVLRARPVTERSRPPAPVAPPPRAVQLGLALRGSAHRWLPSFGVALLLGVALALVT